jgi:succinyl-CoA synthetase beta subunit
MGRVLEHHAKELLREYAIPVPYGEAAGTPAAAAAVAARLGGRVVVKALVPSNRRAKAGGVRFAKTGAASREAELLLGATVCGHEVRAVLVEEQLEFERELFFSILVDKDRQLPLALAGALGGVQIEEAAGSHPEEIRSLHLDPWRPALPHRFRELWASAGLSGPELVAASALSHKAAVCFFETDATILELNPIGLLRDSGGTTTTMAVGIVLDVDDQALSRQPRLAALVEAGGDRSRPLTGLEKQAAAVAAAEPYRGTARFLELEGDVGLLCGGGGGSLVFFDAVRRAGGRPACHTELGGNPSAEKVRGLTRVILSCSGIRGLLVGHNRR